MLQASTLQRKKARKDLHSAPELLPPMPDEAGAEARGINYAIEKNRGLTPHRWVTTQYWP